MYEVVIRKRNLGKEIISKPMYYNQAVASYEEQAATINAVGENKEYLQPDTRISLRETKT